MFRIRNYFVFYSFSSVRIKPSGATPELLYIFTHAQILSSVDSVCCIFSAAIRNFRSIFVSFVGCFLEQHLNQNFMYQNKQQSIFLWLLKQVVSVKQAKRSDNFGNNFVWLNAWHSNCKTMGYKLLTSKIWSIALWAPPQRGSKNK